MFSKIYDVVVMVGFVILLALAAIALGSVIVFVAYSFIYEIMIESWQLHPIFGIVITLATLAAFAAIREIIIS